jgi:hypothetical protein
MLMLKEKTWHEECLKQYVAVNQLKDEWNSLWNTKVPIKKRPLSMGPLYSMLHLTKFQGLFSRESYLLIINDKCIERIRL